MKYFEFNKQEYWALLAAESVEKAYEVYAEEVAYESAEEVEEEGEPKEIHAVDAALMYEEAILKEDGDRHPSEIAKEFNSLKNTTVLITPELV
ncbi:hypothetical protein CN556_04220 [Bacillus wiedmannii]|uniref:hypothetical protein n=1 Tax=Bacillus wiedmannii TaxID=1890302 RepID=UPI000BF1D2FB|nr:hypothetical protein [Bacillus wiedmannii]PEN99220.1 hypothetical protein CN556_04220 [Bacillus wiedmannii]PFZ04961.1 hypothetical protein COL75_07095 [Bacillus wiedmannii]